MVKSKFIIFTLLIFLLITSGCTAFDKVVALFPNEEQAPDEESLAEIAAYIPEETLDDILYDFYTYRTTDGLRKTNQILDDDPDNPMALALMAAFAIHENKMEIANDYASHALNKNNNLSLAHSVRAWYLHYSEERLVAAERECNIALSLQPDSSIAYTICGQIAMELGNYDEGFRLYKKAVELEPDNILALYYLTHTQVYLNYREEAVATSEHAIDVNPDLNFLYFERAYAYFYHGDYDLALEDFNFLIEKGNHNIDIYDYRGIIYSLTGKNEESLKDFHYILKRDPENASYNNDAAYFMALSDQDPNEALTYAEKAVSLDPTNDYYIDTKAYVFYKLGWYDEALELFNGLIEREATYSYFGRAFVYYELGEYDQAKEDIELYLQYNPDDFENEYAEKLLEELNKLK